PATVPAPKSWSICRRIVPICVIAMGLGSRIPRGSYLSVIRGLLGPAAQLFSESIAFRADVAQLAGLAGRDGQAFDKRSKPIPSPDDAEGIAPAGHQAFDAEPAVLIDRNAGAEPAIDRVKPRAVHPGDLDAGERLSLRVDDAARDDTPRHEPNRG